MRIKPKQPSVQKVQASPYDPSVELFKPFMMKIKEGKTPQHIFDRDSTVWPILSHKNGYTYWRSNHNDKKVVYIKYDKDTTTLVGFVLLVKYADHIIKTEYLVNKMTFIKAFETAYDDWENT